MQISKKKNKERFLGLILGLFILISGCSKKVENKISDIDTKEEIIETINTELLNTKVTTTNESNLYRVVNNEIVNVGTIYSNTILDLSDKTIKDFINLKDTDLYVKQSDIQKSDRWYKKNTHLIPYNKNIKLKENYSLFDFKGNKILTLSSNDEYALYILKDENNRYGILFQNEIVYVNEEDVDSIYDNQNSDLQVGEKISVLMYHFFYSEENNETRRDNNFVEVKEFEEQMLNLKENGYTTLTMSEIYAFMNDRANIPEKSVAITIDDGDPSVKKYAYPILKQFEFSATLFLITGQEDPLLSYDYIQMREDGLELQSHSWQMHQGGCKGMGHGGRLLCVDYETGVEDTKKSFDYVDGGFVYCYPFGDVNENAKKIIKDGGAKMAFTTKYGKIYKGMDLLELPRIRVSGGNSIDMFMKSID